MVNFKVLLILFLLKSHRDVDSCQTNLIWTILTSALKPLIKQPKEVKFY